MFIVTFPTALLIAIVVFSASTFIAIVRRSTVYDAPKAKKYQAYNGFGKSCFHPLIS